MASVGVAYDLNVDVPDEKQWLIYGGGGGGGVGVCGGGGRTDPAPPMGQHPFSRDPTSLEPSPM